MSAIEADRLLVLRYGDQHVWIAPPKDHNEAIRVVKEEFPELNDVGLGRISFFLRQDEDKTFCIRVSAAACGAVMASLEAYAYVFVEVGPPTYNGDEDLPLSHYATGPSIRKSFNYRFGNQDVRALAGRNFREMVQTVREEFPTLINVPSECISFWAHRAGRTTRIGRSAFTRLGRWLEGTLIYVEVKDEKDLFPYKIE